MLNVVDYCVSLTIVNLILTAIAYHTSCRQQQQDAEETYVQYNAGICSAWLDHCTSVIEKIGGIPVIDISLEWKLHVCSVYYRR